MIYVLRIARKKETLGTHTEVTANTKFTLGQAANAVFGAQDCPAER